LAFLKSRPGRFEGAGQGLEIMGVRFYKLEERLDLFVAGV
jgi:hypothetical protein